MPEMKSGFWGVCFFAIQKVLICHLSTNDMRECWRVLVRM